MNLDIAKCNSLRFRDLIFAYHFINSIIKRYIFYISFPIHPLPPTKVWFNLSESENKSIVVIWSIKRPAAGQYLFLTHSHKLDFVQRCIHLHDLMHSKYLRKIQFLACRKSWILHLKLLVVTYQLFLDFLILLRFVQLPSLLLEIKYDF